MRPERVFAVVAIVGGLSVLLVLPPFQVPDEPAHFFRAYAVSEGGLAATWHERRVGAFVPASLVPVVQVADGIPFHPEKKQDPADVRALFGRPLLPDERVFVDFPNTALQSPVPYLPQAAGIAIARAFGRPGIALFYAGRVANLVCWIFVVFVAIRAAPVGKWLFVALALAPQSLQQACSVSGDALTNGVCFLFVAWCLRARVSAGTLSRRDVARLAALAGVVALCKIGYLPVTLAVLLVPAPRFGSARRRWATVAGLLAVAALCAFAWSGVARPLYASYDTYDPGSRDAVALIPGVDPARQMPVILDAPLHHALVVGRSLWQHAEFVRRSFVGQLGWGETSLPKGHVLAYLALLLLLALVDETHAAALSWRDRGLLAVVAAGSLFVVATALYLHWTPVGQPRVDGLHGRYLIPLGPPAFLVLQNGRLRAAPRVLALVVALGGSLSTGLMIAAMLARYY